MSFELNSHRCPLIYLITNGETTARTTPATEDFRRVLQLVRAAVAARIDLVQIREKNLCAAVLYELAKIAADITNASATKLLINDRADIAAAAGAAGVHLTTTSLPTNVVRKSFGNDFVIGVSTHSLAEAELARGGGADFVVFGPVFETASKQGYGEPLGLTKLAKACTKLSPFPVLPLGGVTRANIADCIHAGARGVAAISMLQQRDRLADIADEIRRSVGEGLF